MHLICGALGTGKTTLIRQLLQQRPAHEQWAVLVNEWGEVGIDGALIADAADDIALREISGGCICCSSGPQLQLALRRLLSTRPQRLLIEPSGLASPARLIDLLRQPEFATQVRLAPVVTLVDGRRLLQADWQKDDLLREQVLLADLLLASRSDQLLEEEKSAFMQQASELWPPPQRIACIAQGQLPLEWLTGSPPAGPAASDIQAAPLSGPAAYSPARLRQPALLRHQTRQTTSALGQEDWHYLTSSSGSGSTIIYAAGWIVAPEWSFTLNTLRQWLQELPAWAGQQGSGLLRAKGIWRCGNSWRVFSWSAGQWQEEPLSWRRDSRWELLLQGGQPDWEALDARWRALSQGPTTQTVTADSQRPA